MSQTHLAAGFMPLLDSALLVLAYEKGFAENEGLDLHLVRETSWANIRDRIAIGHFDVAQMLAPMPIAASLGLNPLSVSIIVPVTLGLGNNGITVSSALWQAMIKEGASRDLDALSTGAAFARVVKSSGKKLRFGVVHQTSSHNYELRYWMAASGVRPDIDVEIVVFPPQYLPEAMGTGGIDGYCVGEPWNSFGVARMDGRIATVKNKVWRHSPDKVIGMRADWAEKSPEIVAALIRSIHAAGLWASDTANLPEIADIMARSHYLNAPAEIVMHGLSGQFNLGHGDSADVPEHFVASAHHANFPWKSHGLWYYSQMVRWGETGWSPAAASAAAACYRPDLYRDALVSTPGAFPSKDYKVDTGFFDGIAFDPERVETYLDGQKKHNN